MLLLETLIKTYNKKIKKYFNSSNKEQKQVKARVTISNAILQLVQDAVNNEIDEKDDRNTSNPSSNNSNSDFRQPKFISFLLLIRKVILNDLGNKRKY